MAKYGWAVLLVLIGMMNIWFSRRPRLQSNAGAVAISRFLGLKGTRALLLGTGVLAMLLGLGSLLVALAGATG